MYTKAYVPCKDLLGNDHLDVAVSVYNMVDAQCCLGNEDTEAIKGFETFISIATEKLGSNHPDIASVLTTMGQLYYKLNDCYLAINTSLSCINNDPKDEEVAVLIYNLIGTASFKIGEVDVALVVYEDRWANSPVRVQAFEFQQKNKTMGHSPLPVASMDISGVHNSETSVSYKYSIPINIEDASSNIIRLTMELVGGSTMRSI